MRTPLDAYQAIESAIASYAAWTIVYVAVWSIGVAVGAMIEQHSVLAIGAVVVAPITLLAFPLLAFVDIWLMAGALVVPACWALPLYYDWHRPRLLFLTLMLPFAGRMGYFLSEFEF